MAMVDPPPAKPIVQTATMELTNGWQAVGDGPLLLSATTADAVFALSDELPELKAGFPIPEGAPIAINTTACVWVMTMGAPGEAVFAPLDTPGASASGAVVWHKGDL